jgi:hypothetical protein
LEFVVEVEWAAEEFVEEELVEAQRALHVVEV